MPKTTRYFQPDGTFNHKQAMHDFNHLYQPGMTGLTFRTLCLDELVKRNALSIELVDMYFLDLSLKTLVQHYTLPIYLLDKYLDRIVVELTNCIMLECGFAEDVTNVELVSLELLLEPYTHPHPVFNKLYLRLQTEILNLGTTWFKHSSITIFDIQKFVERRMIWLFTLDFLTKHPKLLKPARVLATYPLAYLNDSDYMSTTVTDADIRQAIVYLVGHARKVNELSDAQKTRLLFLKKHIGPKGTPSS